MQRSELIAKSESKSGKNQIVQLRYIRQKNLGIPGQEIQRRRLLKTATGFLTNDVWNSYDEKNLVDPVDKHKEFLGLGLDRNAFSEEG